MIAKMEADERRFTERVSWECRARLLPLTLEPQSATLGMHQAIGYDISEGGVQLLSSRLFALRSNLLVEMQTPEHPEGIQAVGSVAWISPSRSANLWCLGIEFSDVGDNALNSIRTLMRLSTTSLNDSQPDTR
ncbi:PilZ domain-containing protein [uncultured Thiocystis sp.]|jgi:Tfp pilus assembly protein PilZ|uniref:PilZ domain-containing protein n=1 Tax=uncultured Thiocystis sp. TaxID=1202134 RepID=UPI0025F9D887|nr:PilZ domain-containing protein [uncultured Thiocystis sp.]